MKEGVSDELWSLVEPLLPKRKPSRFGGRPRVPDRDCLRGILFVLATGMPWGWLPQGLGCGSGVTCWRRLRDWQEAGVWERLHHVLLERLAHAERLDWSRAALDARALPAKKRAHSPRQTPSIERKRARNSTFWSRRAAFRSAAR